MNGLGFASRTRAFAGLKRRARHRHALLRINSRHAIVYGRSTAAPQTPQLDREASRSSSSSTSSQRSSASSAPPRYLLLSIITSLLRCFVTSPCPSSIFPQPPPHI